MSALDTFSLAGQIAIVTGGGAGIGRAISELFAEAGAAIVVSDLKKETADAVADGIVASGGRAIGVACDVTNAGARKALVGAAVSAFGQVLTSSSTTPVAAGRSPSTCRWKALSGPMSSTCFQCST